MLGGGGNVLGLIFKIKADGTKETKEDIRSLRAEFTKEVNDIKSGGTDAFLSIGKAAGFSTSEIANFKIGAFAAVGAVTAITSAIIAGTVALFQLTKEASDYGSQIWNAHLKTGFAVQTISAFERAGAQADVTLQQMSTGLIKFTNNLAEADAGNKKMLATMSNVGVKTFNDSGKAVEELLKHIAGLKTEQERVAAFSSVFGARMGGTFNQLFEQMGYDIEKFKDELRSQNLLMTEEEARMADAFGDLYERVSQQLTGLTRLVGFVVMPAFGGFFTLLSNSLKENKDDWGVWAGRIDAVLHGVMVAVIAAGKFINQTFASWGNFLRTFMSAFSTMGISIGTDFLRPGGFMDQAARDLALSEEAFKQQSGSGTPGTQDFKLPPRGGGGKQKKDNTAKQNFEAEMSALRDQMTSREALNREETTRLKSEYDQRLSAFDEHITAMRAANDSLFNDTIDKINEEQAALDQARDAGIIKEAEYKKKDEELTKQTEVAKSKLHAQEARLDSEAFAHQENLLRQHNAAVEALSEQRDSDAISDLSLMRERLIENAEWQIANEAQLIQRKLEIELKYNADTQAIQLDAIERKETALNEEIRLIAVRYAEIKKVTIEEAFASQVVIEAGKERADKIIALETERARIIKETSDRNIKAYRDEARAAFDAQNAAAAGAGRARRVNPLPRDIDQFQKLQEQLKQLYGMKGEAFFNAISTGMNAIADATGNALRNFILMGSAGTSFRKFAAEVIASVAQMAVVKAVWELAEGFAALARAFFGDPKAAAEAGAHFQAAAIYGTIAGVAAIAGRVIAGNEFQNNSASTGSGSNTSTGSSSGQSSEDVPTRDIGRRTAGNSQQALVEIRIRRDEGSIVDAVVKDYGRGGKTRDMIRNDGVVAVR